MKILAFLIFNLLVLSSFAQDGFYDQLKFENYNIGYSSSIIYDSSQTYSQFDYTGPVPILLSIWHPVRNHISGNPLTYGELFHNSRNSTLSKVFDYLEMQIDTAFTNNYFESYEVKGYYDIRKTASDFGEYTPWEVLTFIKQLQTTSKRAKLDLSHNFPIVVYHHGAQGSAYENFLLAEYLASKGFIVISANYTLPIEGKMYGYELESFDDTSMPIAVLNYAKNISNGNHVYYIGYSMGAQVGFRTLHEPELADGFVSLETTTEFWVKKKFKKGFKALFKVVNKNLENYEIPILAVANTGKQLHPFSLYDEIQNSPMFHASTLEYFDHGSYTTDYHLRYMINDRVPQKDKENCISQLNLYLEHIKLIETYLNSLENKQPFNISFNENFYITAFNIK